MTNALLALATLLVLATGLTTFALASAVDAERIILAPLYILYPLLRFACPALIVGLLYRQGRQTIPVMIAAQVLIVISIFLSPAAIVSSAPVTILAIGIPIFLIVEIALRANPLVIPASASGRLRPIALSLFAICAIFSTAQLFR